MCVELSGLWDQVEDRWERETERERIPFKMGKTDKKHMAKAKREGVGEK